MKDEAKVIIGKDGSMRFIYDDDMLSFADQGEVTIRRASHVEPDDNGEWVADMSPVGGPQLGPFKKRTDALAKEVDWLLEKGIPLPT
jgi:hypothetical protein